jgi:hypothetical protein
MTSNSNPKKKGSTLIHIRELKESKYIGKADVEPEALVTIAGVSQETIQMPEGGSEKNGCYT